MAVDGFDRGYRAESVLSMLARSARFEVPDRRNRCSSSYDQVEAEIAAVPGVAGVACASVSAARFLRWRAGCRTRSSAIRP